VIIEREMIRSREAKEGLGRQDGTILRDISGDAGKPEMPKYLNNLVGVAGI